MKIDVPHFYCATDILNNTSLQKSIFIVNDISLVISHEENFPYEKCWFLKRNPQSLYHCLFGPAAMSRNGNEEFFLTDLKLEFYTWFEILKLEIQGDKIAHTTKALVGFLSSGNEG